MQSVSAASQLATARLKWPAFVGIWLTGAALAVFFGLMASVASVFALIVILSLLFSALALFNYRIGVVLLILLMPLADTRLFPHEMFGITGLNPFNLLLLLTLVSYFLPRLTQRESYTLFPSYFYYLYLLPIMVAALVGSFHVGDIQHSRYIDFVLSFNNKLSYVRDLVIRPLFMPIIAYLIAAAVRDSKSPERFLGLGMFAVVAIAIFEVVVLLWLGHGIFAALKQRDLLSVTGMHANQLGPFFGLTYGMALYLRAHTTSFWPRILATFAILISLVAGMLSFSRGGYVIFAIVTVIYLVSRRNLKTLAVGMIFIALAGLAAPQEFYDRIELGFENGPGITASSPDELSAGRFYIWSKAIDDLPEALPIGNGIGSFMWSTAIRSGAVRFMGHPHNTYLRTLLDFGLPGSILIFLFFRRIYKGWRTASMDEKLSPMMRGFFEGVSVSFIGYMIFAFTSSGVLPEPDQFFLWVAMGILFGLQAKAEMQQPCAA